MLVHLLIALLQAAPAQSAPAAKVGANPSSQRDSTAKRRKEKKPARRAPVTPELAASAFKDSAARSLLLLARAARVTQDSALQSYDATTFQRISAGLAFTKIGRDRLAFRHEEATKVRWRRGVGAYVDVIGSRAVAPIAGKSSNIRMNGNMSPVPYYPGAETMWIGSSTAAGTVNEEDGIIHPLAEGSEAYYMYSTGDSATFKLPDGKAIRLRELRIRPRKPEWNLAVGSLWFDLSGGQLVRAAYRMSVPMDIKATAEADDSTAFEDVPALIKPMLFPMTASVNAIGVEYGLYQGRFWLPRVQVLEGGTQMSFMRVPFKLEQKFEYDNVNATGDPLPPIAIDSTSRPRQVGTGVSVQVGGQSRSDSLRESRRRRPRNEQCDTSSTGTYTYSRSREGTQNPQLIRIPCDQSKLANSAALPGSIYDANEETFGGVEMDALVQQALSMGAQAGFSPTPPHAELQNLRYNRIEGLSVGARVDQQLGAGYSLHAAARIGIADFEPNVELSAARSDLQRTYSVGVYNRLVSASDWGNPLSLGSSLSAILFGRDNGFYYRASGLELTSAPDQFSGKVFSWSVFAEQQRNARQRTTFSIAHAINGTDFEPNLLAQKDVYAGARSRFTTTYGLDPQAFRLYSDLRLEGAWAETGAFGRVALDMTASHGIGSGAIALTAAAGTTAGTVPAQRFWYLGGAQTVRGQRAGTESGNAFWLARLEYGLGSSIVRPTLFADFGWAGNRSQLDRIGVPMSGAGLGWSIMDGLVRFDVARGINPDRKFRVDTYIEARF